MKSCDTAGGDLIESAYAKPLPWIGLYIAVASFLCAAATASDVFLSFRHRKRWFPCRLFSLNATTLSLLSIATKLPVDLNSAMPRSVDQLSKLSGTVLLCTAMGNILPSIGAMNSSEILSNVVALAILVITIIGNICIQIVTGVIYIFIPEHVAVIALLILLLIIFISSAIAVPAAMETMEKICDDTFGDIGYSPREQNALFHLRMRVEKHWLMAHSGSPQYVLGRSVNSTASVFFCLGAAAILIEALLRGLIWESSLRLCSGNSDYAWSSYVVLAAQSAAVLLGTIAPACRWFNTVRLRRWSWKEEFRVEDYWTRLLKNWKESPLDAGSRRNLAIIAHQLKIHSMGLLISLQKVVVTASKAFQLLSLLLAKFICCFATRSDESPNELRDDDVFHLEGEEDLVRPIAQLERRDLERWIEKGSKKRPADMIKLIEEHSTYRRGFTEVDRVLPAEPPPNCWALPLVTLAAIAAALRTTENAERVQSLLLAVGEGLPYVRLIEKHSDAKGLENMRDAADIVWMKLHLYNRWLDVEVKETRGERKERTVLERLKRAARERKQDFRLDLEGIASEKRTLAAVCMEGICGRILQEHEEYSGSLLPWVSTAMADILGACLTNLPQAIYDECFCDKVEGREKKVRDAASVLGETEEVLRLLEDPPVASLLPGRRSHINGWRRDG